MIYRQFQDIRLSAVGMGCMRLPVIDGKEAQIDEKATEEILAYAMTHGVNYYDTAWGYHDGNSESVMGKLLQRYPRESFYLATKFPGYDLRNMGKAEEIFAEQLKKCRVGFFDFYLVHNVCELNIEQYLDDKRYGTLSYLLQEKKKGRIRHLGFSVHGSLEVMQRFLAAYGKDMEFVQIQLNWLDWEYQDAKAKVELAREYGLPVWVMEPLRGGRLVKLSAEEARKLKEVRPEESAVSMAFRFLQSLPEVTLIVAGLSNLPQTVENIGIFEQEAPPLSEAEKEQLFDIAREMRAGIPCTACRYCTPHCPQELDIPRLLELYNEHCFTGGGFIAPMALMALEKDKQPSACIACGSCEDVCPQQLKISDLLADFVEKLKA